MFNFSLGAESEIERDDYDLYTVRLMSKGPMKSSHGDLSVFCNGMPIENDKAKDIEGITFFTYTSPFTRDNNDNMKICIFSYN